MGDDQVVARVSEPPWTQQQVDYLNDFQKDGRFHPFTCPNRSPQTHVVRVARQFGVLVATADGWVCPDCDYTQGWAHDFMVETRP